MTKTSKNIIIFSLLVLPVLSGYRFLATSASLADVIVILGLIYISLHQKQNKIIIFVIIGLLLLLVHILVVSPNENILTSVSRLIKYSFYIILSVFFLKKYSGYECTTAIRVFLVFASTALITQYMIYQASGKVILFQIPGLMPINDHIDIERIKLNLIWSFRPAGIFFEPAHFGYASTLLSIYLYRQRQLSVFILCITTFAQVLSGSSFALAGAALNIIFVFQSLKIKARLSIIFLVVVVLSLFLTEIYEFILSIRQISRLFDTDSVALYGRLLGGADSVSGLDATQKMIGVGYGNFQLNGFMNSYYFSINSIGYLGTIILSLVFAFYLVLRGFIMELGIISILFFTSGMLFTIFIIYLVIIFINKKKDSTFSHGYIRV